MKLFELFIRLLCRPESASEQVEDDLDDYVLERLPNKRLISSLKKEDSAFSNFDCLQSRPFPTISLSFMLLSSTLRLSLHRCSVHEETTRR